MDRHIRMARTLGCLVASMTIGATVLDWGQPTHPINHRSNTELIAYKIREAVYCPSNGRPTNQQWHAIKIDCAQLAADKETDAYHFFVYRDGNCSVTPNWLTQKCIGTEGTVRVGLLGSDQSKGVAAAAQRSTTDQLIHVLRQECDIPEQQVIWGDS